MLRRSGRLFAGLTALGALALGGSAIAGAASDGSSTSSSSSGTSPPAGQSARPPSGQHVGKDGQVEKLLTGETATKVKEAALAKVSGGTIIRVETDVDTGSPYEAHMQKSDGSQVVVYVDKSFEVTSVAAFDGPSGGMPPTGSSGGKPPTGAGKGTPPSGTPPSGTPPTGAPGSAG